MEPTPDFERGHRAPPADSGYPWSEYHRLTVSGRDDSARPVVLATQVGCEPATGRACFQTLVWRAFEDPLVISDVEMPISATWEFRTSGLWADHICETPFRHWSYGLEAFALGIDDPSELLGRAMGHRLPLGWDMDFVSDEDPVFTTALSESAGSYHQQGTVSAELLFADGSLEIEGPAERSHGWGQEPLVDFDVAATASRRSERAEVALPTFDGIWFVGQAEGVVTSRYRRRS